MCILAVKFCHPHCCGASSLSSFKQKQGQPTKANLVSLQLYGFFCRMYFNRRTLKPLVYSRFKKGCSVQTLNSKRWRISAKRDGSTVFKLCSLILQMLVYGLQRTTFLEQIVCHRWQCIQPQCISNVNFHFFSTTLRGVVILIPTLGLSWIFGIITVNHDAVVWKYIFAVLNSIQVWIRGKNPGLVVYSV